MVTLEQALEIVMQLPLEQREMLIDIIHNRHIESRREEIALDASSAIASFHAGKLKPQPVEEIILELRQSIDTAKVLPNFCITYRTLRNIRD